MERIKQALDKARAERGSPDGNTGVTREASVAGREMESKEVEVEYSQTRIVELDSRILSQNKVICGDNDREGLTAYKMLRTQVLQRMEARGWNALGITSPGIGDGKTLTAINLAISLARELQYTVLLVDLDLRNPCVGQYFGITPKKGINDFLMRKASLSEVMINPGIERLVIVPAAEALENSSELLSSPSMRELVRELKSRYPSRIVLFDLPPLLATDDALAFSPFVDALLLVVRDAKTTRREIEHAMQILQDVPMLGTVLNASSEKISTYY